MPFFHGPTCLDFQPDKQIQVHPKNICELLKKKLQLTSSKTIRGGTEGLCCFVFSQLPEPEGFLTGGRASVSSLKIVINIHNKKKKTDLHLLIQ